MKMISKEKWGGLFSTDSTPLIIGGNGNRKGTIGELFKGEMADITIHNVALSSASIAEVYKENQESSNLKD